MRSERLPSSSPSVNRSALVIGQDHHVLLAGAGAILAGAPHIGVLLLSVLVDQRQPIAPDRFAVSPARQHRHVIAGDRQPACEVAADRTSAYDADLHCA